MSLRLYDVRGRVVRRLVEGFADPGEYVHQWDAHGASGVRVAHGVYLLRMQVGSFVTSRKLIVGQ
jgi:hypothetical protein